jgi:hypothetical protein
MIRRSRSPGPEPHLPNAGPFPLDEATGVIAVLMRRFLVTRGIGPSSRVSGRDPGK